jgi:hypothetical protein
MNISNLLYGDGRGSKKVRHPTNIVLIGNMFWRVPAHCNFFITRGSHFWFKNELIVQNEWLRVVQFSHFFIQKLSKNSHEWL